MAASPQEWVKPEVDPPRICALPRGVTIWKDRALLEELDDSRRGSHLADPEEEHPLDDLGFVVSHLGAEFGAKVGAVLLGHEAFGKVIFLFTECDFQALGDGTGLGRLDAGGFEDRGDLGPAHEGKTCERRCGLSSRARPAAFSRFDLVFDHWQEAGAVG
jgi:hypothetical protein